MAEAVAKLATPPTARVMSKDRKSFIPS